MARIAIIGGGLMGHGIAQVFACAGHEVRITDPSAEARGKILTRIESNLAELRLDRSALERVQVCETIDEAAKNAQFAIEAAPESLPLKQDIFATLERAAPLDAILASNTSVIPSPRSSHRRV